MLSSPSCWAAYGLVLSREYADPTLFRRCHRLTVDAYALQHPGDREDRRAVRSLLLHFLSLHAIFTLGVSHTAATHLLRRLSGSDLHGRPEAPAFAITLADLAFDDHAVDSARWARSAYNAWAPLLAERAERLLA